MAELRIRLWRSIDDSSQHARSSRIRLMPFAKPRAALHPQSTRAVSSPEDLIPCVGLSGSQPPELPVVPAENHSDQLVRLCRTQTAVEGRSWSAKALDRTRGVE